MRRLTTKVLLLYQNIRRFLTLAVKNVLRFDTEGVLNSSRGLLDFEESGKEGCHVGVFLNSLCSVINYRAFYVKLQ